MNMASQFIQRHMDVVFFFYGLAFFMLGVSVLFQVRKGSDFRIGKYLWLLAAFGLLHGVNEWLDLLLMTKAAVLSEQGTVVVQVARYVLGKSSYIFLFLFGISLPCDRKKSWRIPGFFATGYSVMLAVFLIWGFQSGFTKEWSGVCDGIIRYFLALPAAFLTALLFFSERRSPEIRKLDKPSVLNGLTGLGFSFLAYSFFVGLIVKPAPFFPASVLNYTSFTEFTGLPVQFFRAICAVSSVFFVCKVLNIFEYETLHKLDDAYREIIRISNREQMRIGQDLHDDLGQQLTGIAFMSRVLREKLRTQSVQEANDVLSQIHDLLSRSIETTRNLSRGLYPVSIEKEGLGFALQELVENTEKIFGVSCSVDVAPGAEIRSSERSIQLFRIAQEAVTNAVKHGKAKQIAITMTRKDRSVNLSISDDGSGFSDPRDGQEGIGLKIMKYRAGVLGGQLNVTQRRDGGTVVNCTFEEPLNE
ncbi:MAG: sensor histidine kinase [Pontiellaceae bacterium]|nr:sensor histidine kinase [Pontiellaceae bacterium]